MRSNFGVIVHVKVRLIATWGDYETVNGKYRSSAFGVDAIVENCI